MFSPILQYIDIPSREDMKRRLSKDYLLPDNLGYAIRNKVVVDGFGKIFKSQGRDVKECLKGRWIYLGEWLSIWGHCITDNLKKLWFVKSLYYSELGGGGLCISCHGRLSDNFVMLLSLLGIEAGDIKIIRNETFFEELIIPDDSIIIKGDQRFYYKEYANIVNVIRDSIPIDTSLPKKIYFTRTLLAKRKDFGEKAIENIFRQLGFKVYAPEKLSLLEQLMLLKNCEEFATTEGSIAHNVIFCKDEVDIIIIRKICAQISYQFMLNNIRKANVTYIDSHCTLLYVGDPWSGPFLLKINRNLINFAKHRGLTDLKPTTSIWELLRYLYDVSYKAVRYRKRIHFTPNFRYFINNFFR